MSRSLPIERQVTDGPDWVTLPPDYPSALDGLLEDPDARQENGGADRQDKGEPASIIHETPPPHYFPSLPGDAPFSGRLNVGG